MTAREKLDEIKATLELKTDEELARKLSVTKVALDKWVVRGKIPDKVLLSLGQYVVGNGNIQVNGNSNAISSAVTPTKHAELLALIEAYATPKLIEEFKTKLLKIKEVVDG